MSERIACTLHLGPDRGAFTFEADETLTAREIAVRAWAYRVDALGWKLEHTLKSDWKIEFEWRGRAYLFKLSMEPHAELLSARESGLTDQYPSKTTLIR